MSTEISSVDPYHPDTVEKAKKSPKKEGALPVETLGEKSHDTASFKNSKEEKAPTCSVAIPTISTKINRKSTLETRNSVNKVYDERSSPTTDNTTRLAHEKHAERTENS